MKRLLWAIATKIWWLLPFFGFLACAPLRAAFDARPKWVSATLVKLERDDRYETRCGFLCRAFGGSSGPRAYVGTLADSAGHREEIMMFAVAGDTTPHVGTHALWHLWPEQVAVSSRATQYGTPTEFWMTLHSDDDVRPE